MEEIPDKQMLTAVLAWYAGMSAHEAVTSFLSSESISPPVARRMICEARRQLEKAALCCGNGELAHLFVRPAMHRYTDVRRVARAIQTITSRSGEQPKQHDPVHRWLSARVANALSAAGVQTLSDLHRRVSTGGDWWRYIRGLGALGAQRINAFIIGNPALCASPSRQMISVVDNTVAPWELIASERNSDKSIGRFRAPRYLCKLDVKNDIDAVLTWLEQQSRQTRRAYRKEVERLFLWARVERRKPLSSLDADDANAFSSFLLNPVPHERWVGSERRRDSPQWRPFTSPLSMSAAAYTLSVARALFAWLVRQHYVLANPFANVKFQLDKESTVSSPRIFTSEEWTEVREIAAQLEGEFSWDADAAQRIRFVLDFGYETGLPVNELVAARLGHINRDANGNFWLNRCARNVTEPKIALTPAACGMIEDYLKARSLPSNAILVEPDLPLIGAIGRCEGAGISEVRLSEITRRFFKEAYYISVADHPLLASKLKHASMRWLRASHSFESLQRKVATVSGQISIFM